MVDIYSLEKRYEMVTGIVPEQIVQGVL